MRRTVAPCLAYCSRVTELRLGSIFEPCLNLSHSKLELPPLNGILLWAQNFELVEDCKSRFQKLNMNIFTVTVITPLITPLIVVANCQMLRLGILELGVVLFSGWATLQTAGVYYFNMECLGLGSLPTSITPRRTLSCARYPFYVSYFFDFPK